MHYLKLTKMCDDNDADILVDMECCYAVSVFRYNRPNGEVVVLGSSLFMKSICGVKSVEVSQSPEEIWNMFQAEGFDAMKAATKAFHECVNHFEDGKNPSLNSKVSKEDLL